MTSELEEKIWAVATQSEVIGIDLTYNEAVGLINRNLDKSGIAIVTAQAARKQLELRPHEISDDEELEDPNEEHERNYNRDIADSIRRHNS